MDENEILEFIYEHDWNDTSLIGVLDEDDLVKLDGETNEFGSEDNDRSNDDE